MIPVSQIASFISWLVNTKKELPKKNDWTGAVKLAKEYAEEVESLVPTPKQ
jgi:hypothetical protein